MAKVCKKCGCQADDSAMVCSRCGASFNSSQGSSPAIIILVVLLSVIIIAGTCFLLIHILKNRHKQPADTGNRIGITEMSEIQSQPKTLETEEIEDEELRDAVQKGKVKANIISDTTACVNDIIRFVTESEYSSISFGDAAVQISEITGKNFTSSGVNSEIYASQNDNYLALRFLSGGSDAYVIFSKNKNAVYTVSSADIKTDYIKFMKMNYDCVENVFENKGIDDFNMVFASRKTGETLLTGHKSGNFIFYYDYNGQLVICLKNTGTEAAAFDGGFNKTDKKGTEDLMSSAVSAVQNRFGININLS